MSEQAIKSGQRIARALETKIIASGWSVGHRLGREEDIAAELGASRWIVREALAIAELDGFVESRRGQAGGLFVAAPAAETRLATLRNYFVLAGASGADVNEARLVLERLACIFAMNRARPSDIAQLGVLAREPADRSLASLNDHNLGIRQAILRIANVRALKLCTLAMAQANVDIAVWNGATEADIGELAVTTSALRRQQIDAIIAYDWAGIAAAQEAIAREGTAMNLRFRCPPADLATAVARLTLLGEKYPIHDVRAVKKPQALARLIADAARVPRSDGSDKIGSEQELLRSFGVGRAVLREAVRTLERYGVVRVRRGKDGGLFRRKPDPRPVARSLGLYLASAEGVVGDDMMRTLTHLELATVPKVVERIARGDAATLARVGELRATLVEALRGGRAKPMAHYELLAGAVGNPVFECTMSIMLHYAAAAGVNDPEARAGAANIEQQLALLAALDRGDSALARRHIVELSTSGSSFS